MKATVPNWFRWLGLGNLVVALLWCYCGVLLYRYVGTKSLEMAFAMMIDMGAQQTPIPNKPAAHPIGILTWSTPPPPLPVRPTAAPRPGVQISVAETTRQLWAAAMAALAGLLITGGVVMLTAPLKHLWAHAVLRIGFAAAVPICIFGLGIAFGMQVKATNLGQVDAVAVVLMLARSFQYETALALLVALAAAAVGRRALRVPMRPRAWIGRTIIVVFAGTFATLLAVALLIQYAGFPPLPAWVYAVIAVVQSAWAWVLLWAALHLPPEATAVAVSPAVPDTSPSH